MRGSLAQGPFGPWWFQCDPRVATLPAADVGGLTLLLSHWWASGSLPADDESLAALSRLGDAWGRSRLRACLALFFNRDADTLTSIDLAPHRAAREEIRAKRAAAGRASGMARRTPVEHVFNSCSTGVQHVSVPNRDPARKAKDDGVLYVPVSADGTDAGAETSSAPHTPLIERASCDDSLLVGGGGGGDVEQLEMFAPPPRRVRGTPRRSKASREQLEAASAVADAYVAQVQSIYARTAQAEKNIAHWMAKGFKAEDLLRAVTNYAAFCERYGKAADYRSAPHNFFGVRKPAFHAYLKEQHGANTKPPARLADGVSRVRDDRNDYESRFRRVEADAPAVLHAPPAEVRAEHAPQPVANPFAS